MSATTKTSSTSTETKKEPPTFNEILNKASKSAIRGGTAGAVAMGANVACLMWMRTTVRRLACTYWLLGRWFFACLPVSYRPTFRPFRRRINRVKCVTD